MYKSSTSTSVFTIPPLRGGIVEDAFEPVEKDLRWGLLLFALALTACRTTQKTTEQTDSLAVRVSVQDSTRRDIQLHFDELVYWVGQAPLLSLPSVVQGTVLPSLRDRVTFSHSSTPLLAQQGEDTIRTATPPYGGGWEGLYVRIRNGEYKRQDEQKTEVLQDVVEEHTKSTQKILKPPRALGVRCLVKLVIGFFIFLFFILYTLRARRR